MTKTIQNTTEYEAARKRREENRELCNRIGRPIGEDGKPRTMDGLLRNPLGKIITVVNHFDADDFITNLLMVSDCQDIRVEPVAFVIPPEKDYRDGSVYGFFVCKPTVGELTDEQKARAEMTAGYLRARYGSELFDDNDWYYAAMERVEGMLFSAIQLLIRAVRRHEQCGWDIERDFPILQHMGKA